MDGSQFSRSEPTIQRNKHASKQCQNSPYKYFWLYDGLQQLISLVHSYSSPNKTSIHQERALSTKIHFNLTHNAPKHPFASGETSKLNQQIASNIQNAKKSFFLFKRKDKQKNPTLSRLSFLQGDHDLVRRKSPHRFMVILLLSK